MHRTGTCVALALLLWSASAWAGPPLVCHPWEDPQRPSATVSAWIAAAGGDTDPTTERLMATLEGESETLVRMALLQALALRTGDPGRTRAILDALAERERQGQSALAAEPGHAGAARAARVRFDRAFAEETWAYTGTGMGKSRPRALEEAVLALGDDPAAWLALARAATPLMRTGTLEEHARAFVNAWDLTAAMPEGAARRRMRWVLDWDLDHLEAHLLDREAPASGRAPDAAWRLSVLRAALPSKKSHGGLVVHEWGTFTSLQGSDGIALEGLQREEESLPEFVYSRTQVRECPLRDRGYKGLEVPVTGVTQKMETPVLYFYTHRERRLRVRVEFRQGLLTQWYPVVDRLGPPEPGIGAGSLDLAGVDRSFLEWEIDVLPRTAGVPEGIPAVDPTDPWAFAREVNAGTVRTVPRRAPDRLGPTEAEHYLFYRGLGSFPLPLRVIDEGRGASVRNDGTDAVAALFAVEMGADGGRFRSLGGLAAGAATNAGLDDLPWRSRAEVVGELQAAVTSALVGSGLFAEEARAMVRTWSRSWFAAEGARVLWVVPRNLTDALLPLSIEPRPDRVERVLLGRLERLTPAMEAEVEAALLGRASAEAAVRAAAEARLARFDRFVEAAVRRALARSPDERVRAAARAFLESLR